MIFRYSISAAALVTKGILGVEYDGTLNVAVYILLLMLSAEMIVHFVHIHHTTKKIELLQGKINMRTAYFMRKAIWQTFVASVVILMCFLGNVQS